MMPRPGRSRDVVLLAGHPRSGTTWLGQVLGAASDVVEEPDNERSHPLAFGYKRGHRYPTIDDFGVSGLEEVFRRAALGDPRCRRRRALQRVVISRSWHLERWIARQCGSLEATRLPTNFTTRDLDPDRGLFRAVAAACRQSMPPLEDAEANGRARLIKTVHSIRCLEPVASVTGGAVVVLLRNPFAILASLRRPIAWASTNHREVNPDVWRHVQAGSACSPRGEAFQVAQLLADLRDQIDRNPGWVVIAHDQLCRRPEEEIERLCERVGRPAGASLDRLRSMLQPGEGFSPYRSSLIEQIDRWRDDLDETGCGDLEEAIEAFDLSDLLATYEATGVR